MVSTAVAARSAHRRQGTRTDGEKLMALLSMLVTRLIYGSIAGLLSPFDLKPPQLLAS